jgi:O-antigen/teichoic acid export membrane protein
VGQSLIQRILGTVTSVVLARALGPVGLGAYSAVVNTASSAYGIVRLGVDASIHVHSAEFEPAEDLRNVKGKMLSAGLLLLILAGALGALACVLLGDWLAVAVYGQPQLGHWLKLAAFLVVMQCLAQFCFATLAGLHRFAPYARVMATSAVLTAVLLAIGAYRWGLIGALVGLLTSQALTTLGLVFATKVSLGAERITLQVNDVLHWVPAHLRLGFPFYAAGLLSVPSIYFLQGMLSKYAGLDVLGHLRVLSSLLVFVSFVPSAAAAAMISHLTRSSSIDYASFIQQALINIKYVWLFAILSGLALFTFLPWLVKLLFGESYRALVIPSSFAILSAVVNCLLGVAVNILFARKRVRVILLQTGCQMSVFVGAAVLLIPSYGLGGYLASELLGGMAALTFLGVASARWRAQHVVSPAWLMPATLLSVLAAVAILTLSHPSVSDFRLLGMFVVCAATSIVSYFFILERNERAAIKTLIYRKMNRNPI